MNRKIVYSASVIAVVATPIGLAISCGNNKNNAKKTETVASNGVDVKGNTGGVSAEKDREVKVEPGVIVSSTGHSPAETWGKANFANPTITFLEDRNKSEFVERQKTGQPFTLHFHPSDVAKWVAGNDADDAFNKGTIPLENREFAYKILATQMNNNLDVLTGLNGATSKTLQGTVGSSDENSRLFSMWSNINSITSWGGSNSEGLFVIPKGSDINAAHKNGVPILATLFCPPEAFGGNFKIYEDLVAKKDGKYIVADNMIEMARHYGFDGWFLNWETAQNVSDSLRTELGNFEKYLFEKSKEIKESPLYVQLYDYGMGQHFYSNNQFDTGSVDYQYRNIKETHGADQSKLSYGYNFDRAAFNSNDEGGRWNIKDSSANDYVGDKNAWIYTYLKSINPTHGDDKDLQFFSDSQGGRDPRIDGDDSWFEPGKVFNQRTTIVGRKSFSTNFQMGFGQKWFTNGEEMKLGSKIAQYGWKNGGIQSVLPTWKYIIDAYNNSDLDFTNPTNRNGSKVTQYTVDGTTFKATIDEDGTAYNGSTKLHYTGKIAPESTITNRMFASDVVLAAGDKFQYIVQGSDNHPKLAIWLDENPSKPILLDPTEQRSELGHDYHKETFSIPKECENKKMISFGLAFENNSKNVLNLDSRISQLDFKIKSDTDKQNKLISLNDEGDFFFMGERNVRINWQMEDNTKIDHYVIYGSKTPGQYNKDYVLTVSSQPSAYLTDVEKYRDLPITIVAYDRMNNIASENKALIVTSFKSMADESKWTASYKQTEGENVHWRQSTGNGYTTSYEDNDGQLFIGDDQSRIHTIKSGRLETSGTAKWGIPLLPEHDGVKILSISEYDKQNVLAITSSGSSHLIDKNTGEQVNSFEGTKLQEFLKNYFETIGKPQGVTVDSPKHLLSKISLVKKVGDKTLVIGEVGGHQNQNLLNEDGGIGFACMISPNGDIKALPMQSGIVLEGFVQVDETHYKAIARSHGNYDSDRKIQMTNVEIEASGTISVTAVDWSKDVVHGIVSQLDGAFKTELGKVTGDENSSDAPRIMARGEIVFSQKIENKYLFINSMGVAFVLDSDGALIKTASTISVESWKHLIESAKMLNGKPGFNIQGYHVGDILSLINNLDRDRLVDDSTFIFDKNTNSLTMSYVSEVPFAWWGFAKRVRQVETIDLSKLLDASLTSGCVDVVSKVQLSTEDDKKLEGISFMKRIGNSYIVGGGNNNIGVMDSNFMQVPFGQKIYSYDGENQVSIDVLYNDGDLSIPKEYIQ